MKTSPAEAAASPGTAREPRGDARIESLAIRWALIAFVVVALVSGFLMRGGRLPLGGDDSFGRITAWVGGAAAGIVFAIAYTGANRRAEQAWRRRLPLPRRVFDTIVLTIAFATVSALSVEAATRLFQRGFVGMTIDAVGGAALAGACGAFLAYIAGVFGARVVTANLAALATLVLFIGTMASMLTAPDERWWEYHFSQLGNQAGSTSAGAFNGALILTGLIITVFAGYAARDAARGLALRGLGPAPDGDAPDTQGGDATATDFWSPRRRRRAVSGMLVAIGVCMMVVGLVHDAVNTPVHVGAASGMVVVFGLLAAFSLTLLPGIPRSFHVLTIGVVAGIAVSIVLWIPIGYYALTGVEFVSAGLLFAWFVVFARTIAAYAQDGADPRAGAPVPDAR